jgi:hypothetical protein
VRRRDFVLLAERYRLPTIFPAGFFATGLVINPRIAKTLGLTLGLTVPQSLLVAADDEVIE